MKLRFLGCTAVAGLSLAMGCVAESAGSRDFDGDSEQLSADTNVATPRDAGPADVTRNVDVRHAPDVIALPNASIEPNFTGPNLTGPNFTGPNFTGPGATEPAITGEHDGGVEPDAAEPAVTSEHDGGLSPPDACDASGVPDGAAKPTCNDGEDVYDLGDTWGCSDSCGVCVCTEDGVEEYEQVCPDDVVCEDGRDLYAVGAVWTCHDSCNTCTCTEDGLVRTEINCDNGPLVIGAGNSPDAGEASAVDGG